MMWLEHDAKELLAKVGVPVPPGVLVTSSDTAPQLTLPLMVKAQATVGGRGKAGGIRRAETADELRRALSDLTGMTIKGHKIRACRVEEVVDGAEGYLSFSLDAAQGRLNILMSADGGIDIEASAGSDAVLAASAEFAPAAALAAAKKLAARVDEPMRTALVDAAARLIEAFFRYEATLIEINPLFVRADGTWVAGDAKFVTDDNALPRQQALLDCVHARAEDYPEIALKLGHGFDFITLDPLGEIGLVTTGAGLSMQLVDELEARGHTAFNFCDIRTGQLRGDPTRLIAVLRWIAAGRGVRSVLVNFFAGITDLGEIAHLLVTALKAVPELRAPVTARLIGNGYDEAVAVLAAAGNPVRVEPDLDRAIDLALVPLTGSRA